MKNSTAASVVTLATLATTFVALIGSSLTAQTSATARKVPAAPGPSMAVAHQPASASAESGAALLKTYCVGCHNDKSKAGGLTLAAFDPARPEQSADVAEKMIRKLRAGMMPPAGAKRPDGGGADRPCRSARDADRSRARRSIPIPARGRSQRLNRAEYARGRARPARPRRRRQRAICRPTRIAPRLRQHLRRAGALAA